MTDKTQKKVYLPTELADVLDAHPRSNSDLVESALSSYLSSGELEDVERRLDELSRRESVVESERNERNRELEKLQEERRTLEQRRERLREKRDQHEDKLQDAIEKVADVDRDPSNPAIQTQAKRVGLTPEEFIDELPENDTDDDLNSL